MSTIVDWRGRVGSSWAEEWERTDRSFGILTDQLMGKASEQPFMRGLDIGCGAGEVSLGLARGHAGAEIRGVDVSEALVEVARRRASYLGNVSFEVADAANWSAPAYEPDLLVSRHGVMFFDDPVSSFRHLREIAKSHARLVFSCFRDLSENSWASRVEGFLPPGSIIAPDRFSPGPFAFSDKVHVEGILQDAGWQDVRFLPVDYGYVAGTGPNAVDDAIDYFTKIGPAARAAATLDKEGHASFIGRLRRFLANNVSDNIIALRAAAWIVSAKAPG